MPGDSEVLERLARLEAEVKAAFKLIDEQKQLAESVHSLALSVERLTGAQKNMSDKLASVAADVEELKPITDEQGFSMNDDGGF